MFMKDISKMLFHEETTPCVCQNEFKYYKPDYTQETELYRVNDEPINIINNAENVPFLQNVAQQTLVDVSSQQLPTQGLSDAQLAELATPRFLEVDEISDAANRQLKIAYDNVKSKSD